MKVFILIFTFLGLVLSTNPLEAKKAKNRTNMTDKLKNEKVKAAIVALQEANLEAWLDSFDTKTKLTDDGHVRDFILFSKEAIGNEKFISIDRVENDGYDVYGRLQTKKWGAFNVYFKFHSGKDGKFDRLDIGQAQ